jgi:hypothetical protein
LLLKNAGFQLINRKLPKNWGSYNEIATIHKKAKVKSKKKSPRIAQIALIYSSGTASLHRCTGKSWLNSSVTLSAFGIEPAFKLRMGGEYVKI